MILTDQFWINNSGRELNSGSFDMLHDYLAACAFRDNQLDQFFVNVDPRDIYRQLSSSNSGKELNSGSFDMLHAYLADCAFLAIQLD